MLPTLGLDISKASFQVELSINHKLRHRQFANRKEGFAELGVWLAKHEAGPVHACLEATGPYSEALALYLHEQGHSVSVVNPAQIKAFGSAHAPPPSCWRKLKTSSTTNRRAKWRPMRG